MLNDRRTSHQRKKSWPHRSHRPQRIQQKWVDCTPIWHQSLHPPSLLSFFFFLRCTFSHQHTKQSPPFAASAALSYTSSMVNSTWKEKHHVVRLDARFIQILTCTQESWKMSSVRCFSPLSSSTLVGRVWNSRASSNRWLPRLLRLKRIHTPCQTVCLPSI